MCEAVDWLPGVVVCTCNPPSTLGGGDVTGVQGHLLLQRAFKAVWERGGEKERMKEEMKVPVFGKEELVLFLL